MFQSNANNIIRASAGQAPGFPPTVRAYAHSEISQFFKTAAPQLHQYPSYSVDVAVATNKGKPVKEIKKDYKGGLSPCTPSVRYPPRPPRLETLAYSNRPVFISQTLPFSLNVYNNHPPQVWSSMLLFIWLVRQVMARTRRWTRFTLTSDSKAAWKVAS